MNRRNSIILGMLFVILVVEILILAPKELGLSPKEEATPAAQSPLEEGSGQVMRNVHSVESKPEGKEWELWADRAERAKEDAELMIEQVTVKFFASNGVVYTVTGNSGSVVPDKSMRIKGQVVTRSSNGYVFKTETVFYDSRHGRLTSPDEIEMTGPADENGGPLHLTGADMKAEFVTNEITINKNVVAKKPVRDLSKGVDRMVMIRSQRSVFSGHSNMAQFFGNVVMDVDTMQLTGPEAQFTYDPKSGALDSVEVGGGVRVTDNDKFATSDTVSVHFKQDRVVFNGAPRVVQNGDELVGDEIIFLDGGRKVQVRNAKAAIDPSSAEKSN